MTDDPTLAFPEELALLGLARGGERGATASEIRAAFKKELSGESPDFAAALARLAESGLAERLPRGQRQRADRFHLLPDGHAALAARLDGNLVAGRGRMRKAARTLAAAHALGLAPAAAAALVERDALPVFFLAARLGEAFRPSVTLEALARSAAAAALGATDTQAGTLWRALFQRSLTPAHVDDASPAPQLPEPAKSTAPPAAVSAGPAFAAEVFRAARTAREGWFGPRKLFIHRAWEAWKSSTDADADLPTFKAHLLAALRAGELELSRADYPLGLAEADLDAALTHYGSETFHFLTVDPEATP